MSNKRLMDSIISNDIVMVKNCLLLKCNINYKDDSGNTPLMIACFYGNNNIARLLIDEGADVNAQNKSGLSALILCTYYNNTEAFTMLLDAGTDTTLKNKLGNTALNTAIQKNNLNMVNILSDLNGYYLRKKLDIENASDVIKDSCIF